MKEQWTDKLRGKLTDFESPDVPDPDGLWDAIEADLTPKVPFWRSRWFYGCAAVFALAVVSLPFLTLQQESSQSAASLATTGEVGAATTITTTTASAIPERNREKLEVLGKADGISNSERPGETEGIRKLEELKNAEASRKEEGPKNLAFLEASEKTGTSIHSGSSVLGNSRSSINPNAPMESIESETSVAHEPSASNAATSEPQPQMSQQEAERILNEALAAATPDFEQNGASKSHNGSSKSHDNGSSKSHDNHDNGSSRHSKPGRVPTDLSQLTLGLYAMNTPSSSSNAEGFGTLSGQNALSQLSNQGAWYKSPMLYWMNANAESPKQISIKHSQPIRLGLSLAFRLSRHWGLATGVTFAKLKSDMESGTTQNYNDVEQQLCYVGVPLAAQFYMLQTRHWSLYASGGAQCEVPIFAKQRIKCYCNGEEMSSQVQTLHDVPVEWSLMLSGGVQYHLLSGLSLYFEPGISYYFDNHSAIENIYQDKTLNLNLQLGVRYQFGK